MSKMILYHGTSSDNFKDISREATIKNLWFRSHESTMVLSEIFNKVLGYDIRKNAIFLSNCKKSMESYDYAFKISIRELNPMFLHVADLDIAHKIYEDYENGKNVENLVHKYAKSMKRYIECEDDDLKGNKEFLYFREIKVNVSNIVV